MSKTFLLFTTLLLAIFLQQSNSTHLKTNKVHKSFTQIQSQYTQKGACFAELWQKATWRISSADPQWIYTKHGQCKDLNFVGKSLNDDTDLITFHGDCNTCSVQIFDDANLGGDSKTFHKKDCKDNRGITCEIGDWDDRISSARLCCEKDRELDYRYGSTDYVKGFTYPYCDVKFRRDKWVQVEVQHLATTVPKDRCDERRYVGDNFNDNIDRIEIGDQCLDCTIQLFDDADFKGDSKTIKIGSDECPITPTGIPKCGMWGWGDRVSSVKVCCPTYVA